MKERVQEVNSKNHAMEKELHKLRRESETRLKEVKDDNVKLLKDVKILQERDDLEVSASLFFESQGVEAKGFFRSTFE